MKWKWISGHFGYILAFYDQSYYLFIRFFWTEFPISCHCHVTFSCNVLSLYADSHFLPSVDNLQELLNQRWSIETTSFSYSTTLLTQHFDNVWVVINSVCCFASIASIVIPKSVEPLNQLPIWREHWLNTLQDPVRRVFIKPFLVQMQIMGVYEKLLRVCAVNECV